MTATLFFAVILQTSATYTVDATKTHAISPYIYGANFPDWKQTGPLFTVARQGGNRMSAYNWETNASNAGADYRHQNDGYMGESDEPGWTARTFFHPAQKNGAAVILTVPCTGYVSADKKGDGDVANTPNYLQTRFHRSVPKKEGKFEFPPNTKDRIVYQDEFVAWVMKTAAKNTPVWFSLDNESDLWGHTHQRIWPKNPTYAQILKINREYAAAIKAAAPKTLIFGPANYGWQGFRTFQDAPDRNGRDFLDFYLAGMKSAGASAGKRLLDVLDIHWYPEAKGDGVRICFGQDKPGTPAARIQAPRSLWDATYFEDSWIQQNLGKEPIRLLPRVQAQIAKHYPGTKLAITEYNYGGARHVSGLIAQADVLGLFGRYGVFAANNWGISPRDVAQLGAFRAFRDFDGKGGKFGSTGLAVAGGNAAQTSLFASKQGGKLVLVAINKTGKSMPFQVALKGVRGSSAKAYVRDASSLEKAKVGTARAVSGSVRFEAPALSVVTVEVR